MAASSPRQPRRILIIKPSSLGDIVHALPVLAGLRAAYPQAHIAWLVGKSFAPLLEGHPLLDEAISFDRRHYGRMLRNWQAAADFVRFLRALRRRRFDLVVDLQGLIRSGFLSWASGARSRVGFAAAREFGWAFYSRRVSVEPGVSHAVEKNLCVARALGLSVASPAFPLGLRPEELDAARELLSRAAGRPLDAFVAVLPGARWETKRWPPRRFGELLGRLRAAGYPPCVLLGGPEDQPLSSSICGACPADVIDLIGRTSLRQLSALLAQANLVICHDSGPMHLAAALGRPLVAIFGPTDARRTGPYCRTARVVSLPLACSPCRRRRCPLQHHNCMQQLSADAVMQSVREQWAAPSGASDTRSGQPFGVPPQPCARS